MPATTDRDYYIGSSPTLRQVEMMRERDTRREDVIEFDTHRWNVIAKSNFVQWLVHNHISTDGGGGSDRIRIVIRYGESEFVHRAYDIVNEFAHPPLRTYSSEQELSFSY